MQLSELVCLFPKIQLFNEGTFDYLDYASANHNGNMLAFIDNHNYISSISPAIKCIICKSDIALQLSEKYGVILSDNPRLDFYLIHNYLSEHSPSYQRTNLKSNISESARVSSRACIAEHNVIIGDNVIIEDNVIIRENVVIGDNSIIRAGTIIGGEGFQFNKNGKAFFIKHSGGVIIGNDVEVQYNTCIDRAIFPWDNTQIGSNTKLDNLIYIAHAVKIGENTLIAAGSTVGGSTIIGNNCWLGLNSTVSNGLIIGNDVSIKLGAVVTTNIDNGLHVSGNFAIEHNKFLKFIKHISKNF